MEEYCFRWALGLRNASASQLKDDGEVYLLLPFFLMVLIKRFILVCLEYAGSSAS